MVIKTQRLTLRPLKKGDTPFLNTLYCGDSKKQNKTHPPENRLAHHLYSAYQQRGIALWKIIHHKTNETVGITGLMEQQVDEKREVEAFFRILPYHQGHGFATEAMKACCMFAKKRLGLSRLIALITQDNGASIRVAEKNSLRHEQDLCIYNVPTALYVTTPHSFQPK